jgi:hypothetical protein
LIEKGEVPTNRGSEAHSEKRKIEWNEDSGNGDINQPKPKRIRKDRYSSSQTEQVSLVLTPSSPLLFFSILFNKLKCDMD